MSDEIKNNENICSVTHIRRVDITENSESTGDGDDRYTDTLYCIHAGPCWMA